MKFKVTSSGDWSDTLDFLERNSKSEWVKKLEAMGQKGVSALAAATPRESGQTAESWRFTVNVGSSYVFCDWHNDNEIDGFSVAIGLQYGHGTGTGGWVPGQDFINPAIQPVIDEMVAYVWKEITR